MKSYHVDLGAGLDALRTTEHDVPVPGPNEVLVLVRACSLNYRELRILIDGVYSLPVRADVIPVSDGAASVEAIGSRASSLHTGLMDPSLGKRPPSSAAHWTAC